MAAIDRSLPVVSSAPSVGGGSCATASPTSFTKPQAAGVFAYEPTFQFGHDETPYRRLSAEGVSEICIGDSVGLRVDPTAFTHLAKQAFTDIAFLFRPAHLASLKAVLDDPTASDNDKFVCYTQIQNAVISALGQLPGCQDTGTAIVMGKKGRRVVTDHDEAESLSRGVWETYQERNLRYSQLAPLAMFQEKNTANNLPAQLDLFAETDETHADEYNFLFMAKGGGSANKSYLYQQTPAILNEKSLLAFVAQKLGDLGTSACPPYHIALVIGGTSAETNLKTVKLASAKYYDSLPTTGSAGGRAFRDVEMERKVLDIAQTCGLGAQFGGRAFAHDVCVIRMSRHAASCPIGLGVSCSADRNIKGKITRDGIFLEALETNPSQYLPAVAPEMSPAVKIDLDQGMDRVLEILSQFPVKTRLSLRGTLIVARDAAHARIKQLLDEGKPMPEYFKHHPVYYAGPAKTPEGMASGSFGPTTAGRMDSYVDLFQSHRGSMVMLAKGNRSKQVTDACKKHGGFYLGSIGGPAAILAQNNIKTVELVDFEELGMEAVRKIVVEDFPAFILVDDKGNDFFEQL